MSKRGSAQFLLLSLRPRATLGWAIGAAAIFVAAVVFVQAKGDFPLLDRSGLAQALHQSAWRHALAGQTEPTAWPWEASSDKENMSPAPNASVPRLGLSAAVLKQTGERRYSSLPAQAPRTQVKRTGAKVGDVALGDNITVTGADGSSHVYKVTGQGVIDPHLAESDAGLSGGNLSPVSCWPLDPAVAGSLRLIIQGTQAAPQAPQPSDNQRKL